MHINYYWYISFDYSPSLSEKLAHNHYDGSCLPCSVAKEGVSEILAETWQHRIIPRVPGDSDFRAVLRSVDGAGEC